LLDPLNVLYRQGSTLCHLYGPCWSVCYTLLVGCSHHNLLKAYFSFTSIFQNMF